MRRPFKKSSSVQLVFLGAGAVLALSGCGPEPDPWMSKELRQDSYASQADCEGDWGSGACQSPAGDLAQADTAQTGAEGGASAARSGGGVYLFNTSPWVGPRYYYETDNGRITRRPVMMGNGQAFAGDGRSGLSSRSYATNVAKPAGVSSFSSARSGGASSSSSSVSRGGFGSSGHASSGA